MVATQQGRDEETSDNQDNLDGIEKQMIVKMLKRMVGSDDACEASRGWRPLRTGPLRRSKVLAKVTDS